MNYSMVPMKIIKRIVLTATALIAIRQFYVQELIAAVIIFSVLFACLAVVVLLLFLVDQAWQAALDQIEIHAKAVGRAARRNWEHAGGFAMKLWF
jgi:hypothetical protein